MSPSSPGATARRPLARSAVALAAGMAALALWSAPSAQAAPGDNGDVKIHNSTTPVGDPRDEPKVCQFYLDAFNFDTIQQVNWTIEQQPPTGTTQVLAGSITLTNGSGATGSFTLPNGHYKLDWTFEGENGSAKHKVFEVSCPPSGSPSASASSSASRPAGGVGTGGGGSVHGPDTGEVVAGSVLLAGAAGLGVRALRRRNARRASS